MHKFMLLAHGRTGSTSLCWFLNEVAEWVGAGSVVAEPLDHTSVQREPDSRRSDSTAHEQLRGYPRAHCPPDLARQLAQQCLAEHVGFKELVDSIGYLATGALLEWAAAADVRVLLLQRRQALDSFLSIHMSGSSTLWQPERSPDAELPRDDTDAYPDVDPEMLLAGALYRKGSEQFVRRLAEDSGCVWQVCWYHELFGAERDLAAIRKVVEFLGVDAEAPTLAELAERSRYLSQRRSLHGDAQRSAVPGYATVVPLLPIIESMD